MCTGRKGLTLHYLFNTIICFSRGGVGEDKGEEEEGTKVNLRKYYRKQPNASLQNKDVTPL